MKEAFSYTDYVSDDPFIRDYNEYQSKYFDQMRESDRRMLEIVQGIIKSRASEDIADLIDIGCSTGNLLCHFKRAFGAKLRLTGGDLAEPSLAVCRTRAELNDASIVQMNILDLPSSAYDIVVVNAVLYMLNDAQYVDAVRNLRKTLKPGGVAVIFDFAHPFQQELEIIEKSATHVDGLRLCFRSRSTIDQAFKGAGFRSIEFQPFVLPIDLPRPADDSEIISYTVKDEVGRRMAFRGTLYQPWCHMVAVRD